GEKRLCDGRATSVAFPATLRDISPLASRSAGQVSPCVVRFDSGRRWQTIQNASGGNDSAFRLAGRGGGKGIEDRFGKEPGAGGRSTARNRACGGAGRDQICRLVAESPERLRVQLGKNAGIEREHCALSAIRLYSDSQQ